MIIQTPYELKLLKDYILYPILLDVLEVDSKKIASGKMKMPELYLETITSIQKKVISDAHLNKVLLRQHGIKVMQQNRKPECLEATYLCRGYQTDFRMVWRHVRAEVKVKLFAYAGLEIADNKEV